MALLDRDIHLAKALVIDGNATSRSILAGQLRDLGVGTVVQCGKVVEARTHLEARAFDFVLCEHSFHGTDYSGQHLLDDLRRAQLLPLSTVFIMITGEATYAKVTEAAESALDSFLIKPHTASSLAERLAHARRRKKVLKDIFEAVDAGRFEDGAALCRKRFEDRGEFWVFAARIGGELLLNLGRAAEARELYEAVGAAQPAPWARLGVARAQLLANQPSQALKTLEALVAEAPTFVDAYDVIGQVHSEQGNLEAALEACRRAATLTPGSITRLQKQGMLAFYQGEREEAAKALDRAVAGGISSKMFDAQSLVLLAFLRFQQKDTKGLQRCADNLAHALSRAPENPRLLRFTRLVAVLVRAAALQPAEAAAALAELSREVRDEAYDVEAACNLLTLISALAAAGVPVEGAEVAIDAVALRHGTSKVATELLVRGAAGHEPFAERVRASAHQITQLTEQALAHSLAGDPATAVRKLLAEARNTLNGKLLDNARSVLARHQDKIENAAALAGEVEQLRRRYCSGSRLPLGDVGRKAGAMALRTSAPVAEAAAQAAA
ncbi:MAG: tetratricopeptide repeat protein [Rubrivivax sp.]